MLRTLSRAFAALAVAGLTSLTLVGPAAAAVNCPPGIYPPPDACVPGSATATAVTAGGDVTVSTDLLGGDTDGNDGVASTFVQTGTFHVPASGHLVVAVHVPASTPAGSHHIVLNGISKAGTPLAVLFPIRVLAAGGSGLPLTGAEVGAASLLAAGLLGAGTVAVVVSRRRKAPAAA